MLDVFDLTDQVVVMTGAMGIIGSVVAEAMCESGANVILTDISQKELLESKAFELEKRFECDVRGYSMDVSDQLSVRDVFKRIVQEFHRIDVLIHCAAIDAKIGNKASALKETSFEHFSIDHWNKSVDVNMTGTFIVTQEAIKIMLKRGCGNIIHVPSTYSFVSPNQDLYLNKEGKRDKYKPVDYVATKSFVPNFTRYIATYYGEKGIRANCIVPHGVVLNSDQQFKKNFEAMSPLKRFCKPSELKGPFVFLASKASSYMTGSMLFVDGGWTAW